MKRDLLIFCAGAFLASAGRPLTPFEPSAAREVGWDFWEAKGTPKLRVELAKEEGGTWRREGSLESWYENGERKEQGALANGRATGLWHKYWDNGQLKKKLSYEDGKIHGAYESWHANGVKAGEGRFEHGQPVGSWKAWNEDGSLDEARSGEYAAGELAGD